MQSVIPLEITKLVLEWLLDNDLPAEWEDAVAQEFEAALTDREAEILSTFAEGRPFDMPITDWLRWTSTECREMMPYDEAPEAAANQGHRY